MSNWKVTIEGPMPLVFAVIYCIIYTVASVLVAIADFLTA